MAVPAVTITVKAFALAAGLQGVLGKDGVPWPWPMPIGYVEEALRQMQLSCEEKFDTFRPIRKAPILLQIARNIVGPLPEELQKTFTLQMNGCNVQNITATRETLGQSAERFIINPSNWEGIADCVIDGDCEPVFDKFIRTATASASPDARRAANSVIDIIKGASPETFAQVQQSIGNGFGSEILGFSGTTDSIFDSITEPIIGLVEEITATVNGILTSIQEAILSSVESAIDAVTNLVVGIVQPIVEVVNDVVGKISDFIESVLAATAGIISDIGTLLQEVSGAIFSTLENIGRQIGETFESVVSAVTRFIEASITAFFNVVQDIDDFIIGRIDDVLSLATATIDSVVEKAIGVADALRGLPDQLLPLLDSVLGNVSKALPSNLITAFTDKLVDFANLAGGDQEKISQTALFGEQLVARQRGEFAELFQKTLPKSPFMRLAANFFVGLVVLFQATTQIATAQSNVLIQEYSLANPTLIFQPGDAARAVHYGLLPREQALLDIRRGGFSEQDAQILLGTQETRAPETETLAWWLRDLITDEEIDKQLAAKGFNPDDIARWKEASFFIPPIQDLITMAVREAFTPEIAERFGQFEDFPPQFEEFARKQGVSEEWSRRYWAAHWALPSVQMGFEMLHRRVIELDDLNLLLRASDVMPFWRDKLVAISFSPITRVDIRRLHKFAILSEEGVFDAYRDIGYNDENARKLTDFTVELNREVSADDPDEIKELTRGNIINFFKDGILLRPEALLLLIDLGFTLETSGVFLDSAELDIERAERSDNISLILEQARAGILTFIEAQTRLDGLELQTIERDRAVTKLIRQEAARTQLPSRADMDKMLEARLINDGEYLDTMSRRGFSTKWARSYLSLAKAGFKDGAE